MISFTECVLSVYGAEGTPCGRARWPYALSRAVGLLDRERAPVEVVGRCMKQAVSVDPELLDALRTAVRDELRAQLTDEVLTAEQVAAWLGINVDSCREAANRGDIPHRRIGRRMLFSRNAINTWLAGSSVKPRWNHLS